MGIESPRPTMSARGNAFGRTVHLRTTQSQLKPGDFPNNTVQSTKYSNCLVFMAANLFLQFKRTANLWFLLISILQVTVVTPWGSEPTNVGTWLPLVVCVMFRIMLEAFENCSRHRMDQEVNDRETAVLMRADGGKKWVTRNTKWKDVQVGNVVCIDTKYGGGGQVPCDMVILVCQDRRGCVYVETSQLDGESNLKLKYAVEEINTDRQIENLGAVNCIAHCNHPSPALNDFFGTIQREGEPRATPIDERNLLLRGSRLRNTDWLYGLAVYTGHDTKMIMNSPPAQQKSSRIEDMLNTYLVFIVVFIVMLTIISFTQYWLEYCTTRPCSRSEVLIQYLLLYHNMVPITLYITLDIVRLAQGRRIEKDPELQGDGESLLPLKDNESNVTCRSSSLTDNLGQVDFVLCDKTGTLTQNCMNLCACAVGPDIYGLSYVNRVSTSFLSGSQRRNQNSRPSAQNTPDTSKRTHAAVLNENMLASMHTLVQASAGELPEEKLMRMFPGSPVTSGSDKKIPVLSEMIVGTRPSTLRHHSRSHFRDEQFMEDILKDSKGLVSEFAMCLLICHTCFPDESARGDSDGENLGEYAIHSTNRDEDALLYGMYAYGYELISRKSRSLEIKTPFSTDEDDVDTYEIIAINEFTSERKYMSILVEHQYDEGSTLYLKGADSVVLSMIAKGSKKTDDERENELLDAQVQLNAFAALGLRTLVCAKRELTPVETQAAVEMLAKTRTRVANRGGHMEALAEMMERNLELLGIVGVEDKIQEGVPETIDFLKNGGINVWMLTGDKKETSINIALSSHILTNDTVMFALELHDREENTSAQDILTKTYTSFNETHQVSVNTAVLIDGASFVLALESCEMRETFVRMAIECNAVIVWRLSPNQKRLVVDLLQRCVSPRPMVLAIGDGANDVAMIQEAHVGVGIVGNDGKEAGLASDFSIRRFSMLKRLLFYHGQLNYHRVSAVVSYSFFKNVVLQFPHFVYSLFNPSGALLHAHSVQTLCNTLYNILLTSIPIIVKGIYDEGIPWQFSKLHPLFYNPSCFQMSFSLIFLIRCVAQGAFWGAFVFFVVWYATSESVDPIGQNADHMVLGMTMFFSCVIIANIQIVRVMHQWTNAFVLSVCGSCLLFFLAVLIVNAVYKDEVNGVLTMMLSSGTIWLILLAVASSFILWHIACEAFCKTATAVDHILRFEATNFLFSVLKSANSRGSSLVSAVPQSASQDKKEKAKKMKDMFTTYQHGAFRRPKKKWFVRNYVMKDSTYLGVDCRSTEIIPALPSSMTASGGTETTATRQATRMKNETFHDRINLWTLKFYDADLESLYIECSATRILESMFTWQIVTATFVVMFVVYTTFFGKEISFELIPYVLLGLMVAIQLLLAQWQFFRHHYLLIIRLFFVAIAIGVSFVHYALLKNGEGVVMDVLLIVVMYSAQLFHTFTAMTLNVFLIILLFARFYRFLEQPFFPNPDLERACAFAKTNICLFLEYVPMLSGISVLMILLARKQEYLSKFQLDSQLSLEKEKDFNTEVLGNMLPPFVISALTKIRGPTNRMAVTVRDLKLVTVVFCDISNFPAMVASLEPLRLVKTLDMQFRKYDRFCDKYGITKIETVAETFLAAGGVEQHGDPKVPPRLTPSASSPCGNDFLDADNCVKFSLEALMSCSMVSAGSSARMRLKIGLSSGRVIAGLVGSRKPQYALFGDTVNTAARMKSTCEEHCIHISASTYAILKADAHYDFEEHQTNVKGKGMMRTYLIRNLPGKCSAGAGLMEMTSLGREPIVPRKRSWGVPQNFLPRFLVTDKVEEKVEEEDVDKSNFDRLYHSGTRSKSILYRGDTDDLVSEEKTLMHRWTLRFRDPSWETKYRQGHQTHIEAVSGSSALISVCILTYAIQFGVLLYIYGLDDPRNNGHHLWIRVAIMLITFILWVAQILAGIRTQNTTRAADRLTGVSLLVFLFIVLVSMLLPLFPVDNGNASTVNYSNLLDTLFWLTVINTCVEAKLWMMLLAVDVILFIIYCCVVLSSYKTVKDKDSGLFEFLFLFVCVCVAILVGTHHKEFWRRLAFYREAESRGLSEDSRTLLDEMLPSQIVDEMCHNQLRVAYDYRDMTLLFGDICGFTAYCKSVPAKDVVNLVTKLFSGIDEITRKVGIYKVCTIGDCYVAINEPDQKLSRKVGCSRMLDFAEKVLAKISEVKKEVEIDTLSMRIGMHLASFVGGVIGTKKLRFDIWGMDVLVSNMVEQNGVPGKIVVSEDLKRFCTQNLPLAYSFASHKEIVIMPDSVGAEARTMSTYILTSVSTMVVDPLMYKELGASGLAKYDDTRKQKYKASHGTRSQEFVEKSRVKVVHSNSMKKAFDSDSVLTISSASMLTGISALHCSSSKSLGTSR